MHVIAGFESQIAARAAIESIRGAAGRQGAIVDGAALARRGAERQIHIEPVEGFELPDHVLRDLDEVVAGEPGRPTLSAGETVLVVSFRATADRDDIHGLVTDALRRDGGELWMTIS